jgi:murein DD-endopeptidase MepM/ murein hydrolase activator NlpD
MSRALVVLVLVAALALPETALANGNGGVAYTASGGSTPHVVKAPKPPKKRKRRRKRPPRPAPAPAPAGDSTHRLPLAGAFTWPGPDGSFGAGRAGHIHQGIDLLAASGTPIVAPEAGTVSFVAYQAKAAGYYVVLHSPDYDFAFMHLLAGSTRVRVGQTIAAGDPIGLVGQTGDAEAPHLHFEVWVGPWQQGGRPIDPAPLLHSWPAT